MHIFCDHIFCDIETGQLPVSKREYLRPDAASVKTGNLKDIAKIADKIAEAQREWERGTDCALDPMQAEILVIGYAIDDGPVVQLANNGSEADILDAFWNVLTSKANYTPNIVGHNIRFDAGMLVRRSWAHGVVIPSVFADDLHNYKPLFWLDTMAEWALGDRRAEYISLKKLCGFFGVPVKDGEITGENFGAMWAAGRTDECLAYNAQDIEATREVWKRMTGCIG